jgi:hypothetical protein
VVPTHEAIMTAFGGWQQEGWSAAFKARDALCNGSALFLANGLRTLQFSGLCQKSGVMRDSLVNLALHYN